MSTLPRLPFATADLPGTGGALRRDAADFRVDEVPAYEPSGSGDHVYARIEKTGLDTAQALRKMANALGVQPRDVGSAGRKDRHAVTTQWLSFPPPTTPDAVSALEIEGIRVLEVARHGHKLRTGHLRGNRFTIRVREPECEDGAQRAERILHKLSTGAGCPNWFGPQRFGHDGQNADKGRKIVDNRGKGAKGHTKRFVISAYQSLLFNKVLELRMNDGLLNTVVAGDLLMKTQSGGLFECDTPDLDQLRMEAGEVVPTGPMFGHKMKQAPEGSEAREREDQVLAGESLALSSFAPLGKLAQGTRRALAIRPEAPACRALDENDFEVSFQLPSGSYATAVLHEIQKRDFPR